MAADPDVQVIGEVVSRDKQAEFLRLRDKINDCAVGLRMARAVGSKYETIQELTNELGGYVNELNLLSPNKHLSELLNQITQPGVVDKLLTFIDSDTYRSSLVKIEDQSTITEAYRSSQQEDVSTIDSHDLKNVLSKQRETIKSLTEINQLRSTVKNGVENTLRSNLQGVLAADQIESLINHRGTKAELDKIVNSLTLRPHQSVDSLTHAIAENLLHSSDQRLHLLVQLSLNHEDNIQKAVTKAINDDKETAKAFKHIEEKKVDGKATNNISELLKDSVISDKNQQPVLKPQLESILAKNNLTLSPLELAQVETLLESHLLTHASITTAEANALINTTLVNFGAFRQLAPEVQLQIASEAGDAFQTAFESMGKNEDIAAFRTVAATNGVDSNILVQNLTTEGFTTSEVIADAYDGNTSHGSSYNLSPHQLRLVADVIKDPGLLQKPEFASEFFGGTIESPNSMAERWAHVLQPSSTPKSGFISTIKSWGQTTFSRFQTGFKGFSEGAKAFFEPLGKGLSKLGSGTFGTTLKNIGSSVGSFLKTALPQLGKALVAAGKALGGILAKAGAALIASSEVWVPILIIGIIIFVIVYPIFFLNPTTELATNISPAAVGGGQYDANGQGRGYCDPKTNPECTPLFCIGNCLCPATGQITQGPGGSWTHRGANAIDIAISNGTPVYSISSGTVTYAGFSPAGYGNLVIISNPDGTKVYYGHLEAYFVRVGQGVGQREQIGISDNTGNSTGPHLHLEYLGGGAQNILNLFNFTPEQIKQLTGCSNGSAKSCGGIVCR